MAVIIFLLFVGTSVYRLLYPDRLIQCKKRIRGVFVTGDDACFTDGPEVVRFVDDHVKAGMACTVSRVRKCDVTTPHLKLP